MGCGAILGLVDGQFLQRRSGRKAERRARPIEEKESFRWLEGAEQAASVCAGAGRITVIADRESDIYEAFALRPQGTDLLIRAAQDRSLENGGTLFAALDALPSAGQAEIDLPAGPGRRARKARLDVRFATMKLARPNRRFDAALPEHVAMQLVDVRAACGRGEGVIALALRAAWHYRNAMSTHLVSATDKQAIEHRDQLIAPIAAGEKPRERWRIGTEHEKLVYAQADHHAPSYTEPGGIRDLLLALQEFGWSPVEENGPDGQKNVIAMSGVDGGISLEPAGQFELSGAPLVNLHQTCAESGRHLEQVKAIGARTGTGFLGLGMWPDKRRDELPFMPKGRYDIMLRHMPRVGSMGLDMMLRTCTIQTNLDYSSEADMVHKFRVSLALQPLATALFANSPFTEGKPNGFLSYRSHIWSDTDPARTGMLPFVFEDGFGYERYVDYMLDVPMYFVYRDGRYIDAAGQNFRDFLAGKLPALPGELPQPGDWIDHMSTAFPEVRLKSFLEMRGADGGPTNRICALPALWVGLLYDQSALDAAWDLVKDWTIDEREALRDAVPRQALDAPIPGGGRLRDLAKDALAIARSGLSARCQLNGIGDDETGFLTPLDEIVSSGKVPAQRLLDKYHGEWDGDISRVYEESF